MQQGPRPNRESNREPNRGNPRPPSRDGGRKDTGWKPVPRSKDGKPMPPRQLSRDEEGAINELLARFVELCSQAGAATDGETEDTPQLADAVARWWHALPPRKRPAAYDILMPIAAAIGDWLQDAARLEWRMVEIDGATAACLTGAGGIRLDVFDDISATFEDSPDGCAEEYIQLVWPKVEHLKR